MSSRVRTKRQMLQCEPLENRRMLATITVNSALDNFDVNAPATDSMVTLREAILAANQNVQVGDANTGTAGEDTIRFAPELAGQTILLDHGQLEISEDLRIDASGLADGITIDAQQQSRVIFFSQVTGTTDGDLTLSNLTIRGGQTAFGTSKSGGGIYFQSFRGSLDISESTITDNHSDGFKSHGGGIYFNSELGNLNISNSSISDNHTAGIESHGGGIFFSTRLGRAIVTECLIDRNYTQSNNSVGGGIAAIGENRPQSIGDLLNVSNSRITGNRTEGFGSDGGGIYAHDAIITGSIIAENSAGGGGTESDGGGLKAGMLSISDSAIFGNAARGNGGGIDADTVTLTNSTVSENRLSTDPILAGRGGGVHANQATILSATITRNSAGINGGGGVFTAGTVRNSIIAGNTITGGAEGFDVAGSLALWNSLIGDGGIAFQPSVTPNANGNIIGGGFLDAIDPRLGPLKDNGGPTPTHGLKVDSPALNLGQFGAPGDDDIPLFDQRGEGFTRVLGGRLDIGAFEGFVPPDGDFDEDGDWDCDDIDSLIGVIVIGTNNILFDMNADGAVDLLDRDAWLAAAGANNHTSGNPYYVGDANLDGFVDTRDFNVWNNHRFRTTNGWCEGDFDANGVADVSDFNLWNANKFQYSDGPMSLRANGFGKSPDGDSFIQIATIPPFVVSLNLNTADDHSHTNGSDSERLIDRVFASPTRLCLSPRLSCD